MAWKPNALLAAFIASPLDDILIAALLGGGVFYSMGIFNRKKPIPAYPGAINSGYNPGFYVNSPQWYPGESVHARPSPNLVTVPETITDGINEDPNQGAVLHYTFRQQPDAGGALNFSYDLYQLPLHNVAGPYMVARKPTRPCGSYPTAYFQDAPVTSIGGLIPGQLVHQPLLDPNAPGSGYDYGTVDGW